MFEVGQHLANEIKTSSAQVLLAPTICLHRGPLGGRNFESFSEDPPLTRKLAVPYINGLQVKGVAAIIKRTFLQNLHLESADIRIDSVGNEQETLRLQIDPIIQERPLRELYLRPFEIAIREVNPWAVMLSTISLTEFTPT